MSHEGLIFSEPAVTKRAKDFLHDISGSAAYREAADKAVSEVVNAITERLEREVNQTTNQIIEKQKQT
jgi:hypothetical protein